MRENFQQEVGIMKELDHPNICTVYESYDHGRHVYLVMEYCAGLESIFLRYLEIVEQMRNSKTLRIMCMRNMRVQFGFVWKDDGYALVIKHGLLENAPFSSMIFQ
jgi:hypothetical protein